MSDFTSLIRESDKKLIVPCFFNAKLEDVLQSNSGKKAFNDMFISCLKNEKMYPADLLLVHKFLVEEEVQTENESIPEDLEIPKLERQ